MGYGEIWKILDDLIIEFRKRGETIPANVMEDLRAAKTMIHVWKADPSHAENIPSIEMYMSNVESYLIFAAQKKFGAKFAENWMEKLREARKTIHWGEKERKRESVSKFVPGLPRGEKWVRIQVSVETPKNEIKRLASECGLSTREQTDGYMLVFGGDEKLKLFVHKTGEKLRRRKGL
ncbi:MAG: DUF2096 domain-containing protein [Candidatus Bathyarchaeota archaeon]|nr:DUF2096 domain-containing protein [Candidatus Bathyarchaeota archaeon]